MPHVYRIKTDSPVTNLPATLAAIADPNFPAQHLYPDGWEGVLVLTEARTVQYVKDELGAIEAELLFSGELEPGQVLWQRDGKGFAYPG